ncbi:MAG TPA: EAL domain-containing protein [Polyangiaceae bacterium]|jgi:EAL domain-containing protein (putative c-di-GMP-specific phosphodiesterase class I)|nr:EAL domain-containing protein [Polyangiaceae bacterium]
MVEESGGGRVRILVAEDDDLGRRLIQRILATFDWDIVVVPDGAQALERFAAERFDVVLTDIFMPNVDGIALLRAIRERDLEVPIIVITGAPDMPSAISAIELGAFGYLPKPFDIDHLRALLQRAVQLSKMARMKRAAMNVVGSAHPRAGDRAGLDAVFTRAIESLWMAYQPIVRAADHTLFGYEALMRSSEPALPHPGAVLDAAEKLGRLHLLGQHVRARAAEPIVHCGPETSLFVNLHASDLADEALLDSGAPLSQIASRVVLEVTERASLDDVPDVRERVHALREMGYRIAVDDLGAGYAGLTSFTLLEPDVVKLDMDLVRGIDTHRTKRSIVSSMVTLCHEMKSVVVAEGVETPAERDALVDLGCDFIQGYLLAKPGPAFPTFNW